MNNLKFIALILIVFLSSEVSPAKTPSAHLDSVAHELLLKGIHQVHNEEYFEAIATFEKLIDHLPDHPVGYFGKAAAYKTIMQNYRVNQYETALDSLLNLTIQIGEKASRKDVLARFYLGGAYGYRGLHKVRKRNWLGAFNDGLKGINALQEVLEIDPTLYDAYFGLGAYHYWRSAKAKILRVFTFSKTTKKGGSGKYGRPFAKGLIQPSSVNMPWSLSITTTRNMKKPLPSIRIFSNFFQPIPLVFICEVYS